MKAPDGGFAYKINRSHELVASQVRALTGKSRRSLEILFRLLEETVPVQRIWIDTADDQDGPASPFAGEDAAKLRELIVLCYEAQVSNLAMSSEAAWGVISSFEAFQGEEARAIIGQLREEMN